MKQARLILDRKKEKTANPLIFGHFIEFMRDCIDEGMWAQLLKNRGFDRKKEIPAGVVDGNPNIADGWFRTGYKNTFAIALDAKESLARDGYSQKIHCFQAYDGYVGVAQGGIYLEPGRYEAYVWAKAETETAAELLIWDEDLGMFGQREMIVTNTWEKYSFQIEVTEKTRTGVFEIRLPGEGTLWLDGASLMPAETVGGIWPEVFSHIQALKPPVIRFPGGCFADCYHWEDGIGARDSRPYRRNRHWGGWEDNSFGTDEYMEFCRNTGCEPMICVNFGSGTAEEAANWVEYCNGDAHTPYGRLRAANGHPEPYHIRYWDIGNETFGDWEIGHCSAREYAEKYLEFYHAMKAKDDSLVFMICGGDGDSRSQEWNRQISEIIGDQMDVVCLHMYVQKDMQGQSFDNSDIYYATTGAVKKYEEILIDSWQTVRQKNPHASVAVTEYNLGTLIDSYREQTLEAALFNAGMWNLFLRHTERLAMCNISDLVNGWPGGCIVSKNGHAYGTASYYGMKLYAESGITKVLDSQVICETYDTCQTIGNIEPLKQVPALDCAVCRDEEENLLIFAVNRLLDEEMELQILDGEEAAGADVDARAAVSADAIIGEHGNAWSGIGIRAHVTELYSEKTSDMNLPGDRKIFPRERMEELPDGKILLKPHSITRIKVLVS